MLMRIFTILIVLIAVAVGALAILPVPKEFLLNLIVFRDFFEVSLPILAFGALVKFICWGGCGCNKDQDK